MPYIQCPSNPQHGHVFNNKTRGTECYFLPHVSARYRIDGLTEPMSTGARWTANGGRLRLNPKAVRHFISTTSKPVVKKHARGSQQMATMAQAQTRKTEYSENDWANAHRMLRENV